MDRSGIPETLPLIDVACGVLVNDDGDVLMARRPPGRIAAGYWEFPGGKIEPGEAPLDALARELFEELGVRITAAAPLLDFTHAYTDRRVRLQTFQITQFEGVATPREGQTLAWRRPGALLQLQPQLPTVAPILAAIALPAHYAWTPAVADAAALAALRWQPPPGAMVRLRQPRWGDDQYATAAVPWVAAQRAAGRRPLLDRSPEMAQSLGAGFHLRSRDLTSLSARPLPVTSLCIASVHDEVELLAAIRCDVDAVVIGHVQATPSHALASPMGWERFSALARQAGRPAYAIGGLTCHDLDLARQAGAQGIAAIRAYGSSDAPSSVSG